MPLTATFGGVSTRSYGFQGSSGIPLVGDFDSIATTTVGAGGASSVTFSSIPQNYTHLQIRMIARNTVANSDDNVYMYFNSDTGANYSYHYVYGFGTGVGTGGTGGASFMIPFRVTGANSTASAFGVGVCDILDYNNTNKFKTTRSLTGHNQNNTSDTIFMFSNNWRSTSAITSITINPPNSNFVQHSSFALYGIKA